MFPNKTNRYYAPAVADILKQQAKHGFKLTNWGHAYVVVQLS